MDSTSQLGLPLLMPAQAQKHVTVNEALAKLDAFAQLRVTSLNLSHPPSSPKPGQSFVVAGDGGGLWLGQEGSIATYCNGGWTFTQPLVGWRAWDEESETWRVFDGAAWVSGALATKSSGGGAFFQSEEFLHVFSPGVTNITEYKLPAASVVFGITGRIVSEIKGSGLSSWRLGVEGSEDRYGSNLGIRMNSYVLGVSGTPLTYYENTPLLLSTDGGEFSSGLLRLAVHYMALLVPRPV